MMNSARQPYGTWTSPLLPHLLASDVSLQDVQWDDTGETLVWLESRSGTGVLVCRQEGAAGPRDLTRKVTVRARVGYGGGDFVVSRGMAYFVNDCDVYQQKIDSTQSQLLTRAPVPVASPTLSPDGRWLLVVASAPEKDSLLLTDSEGQMEQTTLYDESDFCMQPAWSPDSRQIAWVAWNQPNMPWLESYICLADLETSQSGLRIASRKNLNSLLAIPGGSFQPCFSPDGRWLSFVSDRPGWFNLHVLDLETMQLSTCVEEPAEHAPPAWIQGLRSHAWVGNNRRIYLLRSKGGSSELVLFDLGAQSLVTVPGLEEYPGLRQLTVSPISGAIAVIATSHNHPARIITLNPSAEGTESRVTVERRSSSELTPPDYCSRPEEWTWGSGTSTCHGLYYPPRNPSFQCSGSPPVIIKIHGGPTSEYTTAFDSDTFFFTSRGYAVLALNYRGSSGYGRAYRDALDKNWGLFDVEDTRSAADYLVSKGKADPDRIALMGGSAGGFTVLNSLIRYPGFYRAGVCRYAVSDLLSLAQDTHRFEAFYHCFLIGDPDVDLQRYKDRSPALQADRIRDPLALFQGTEDKVVSKGHSDVIVQSLLSRSIPHLYKVFDGEGHGWRKAETIEEYYRIVEDFLAEHVLPGRASQGGS